MKCILFAAILAASTAQAATFYIVDGKQVASAGEAKKLAFKNPKATVLKIQATEVKMNDETMNLKKSRDLTASEVQKAAATLK